MNSSRKVKKREHFPAHSVRPALSCHQNDTEKPTYRERNMKVKLGRMNQRGKKKKHRKCVMQRDIFRKEREVHSVKRC